MILTGHSVLSFLHYFDAVGCAAGNIRHVKKSAPIIPEGLFLRPSFTWSNSGKDFIALKPTSCR